MNTPIETFTNEQVDNLAIGVVMGAYDSKLDYLQTCINDRRDILRKQRAAIAGQLQLGDRVRLVNVSPKAANNLICEVVETPATHNTPQNRIGVKLPRHVSRKLYEGYIGHWPNDCYEKVDD